jgi:hypothetical protein
VLRVGGEDDGKIKSELIKYGLEISFEGLIELYGSVEEGNRQIDFFSIFSIYFLYFD